MELMTQRPCTVEGCTRPLLARGLCAMHYSRQRTKGDVGPPGALPRPAGAAWGEALRQSLADPEVRARMSAKAKQRRVSPATRARLSAANKGKTLSTEHRAKIAAGLRGHPVPSTTRERISRANAGRVPSEAELAARRLALGDPKVRARMSASHLGRALSPERRKRQSMRLKGRPHDEQWRRHLVASLRSPEVRAKLSRAQADRFLSGRVYHSKLEARAAVLITDLGFRRFVVLRTHAYDFGDPDTQRLIEVNGCYFHPHQPIKPDCRVRAGRGSWERDEAMRQEARDAGWALLELWECEEELWHTQLTAWLARTGRLQVTSLADSW